MPFQLRPPSGRSLSAYASPTPRALRVPTRAQATSSSSSWSSLQLAKRKLELAVQEENYALAAEAKAEVERLTERLPANKALLSALLDRLERPGSSTNEKLTAVQQLGALGDMDAAPALASFLHEGEGLAVAAEESLWQCFMRCPTPELEAQMQRGVVLMRRPEQWDAALTVFDDLVAAAPTFAEGYNKRATVNFLQQRYSAAIADCKVALALNPYHFAAASGMGMCCGAVGDTRGAVAAFEHAVAINPRLKHLRQHIMQLRSMLQEDGKAEGGSSNSSEQ